MTPLFKDIYEAHKDKRFVEPFCGSCAVGLGIEAKQALMNDLTPHLINLFQQIKNGLICSLRPEDNTPEIYYQKRAIFNENIKNNEINTPIMAELFYYLNRTGFNGMCRFNKKGLYNIPCGSYTKINYINDFSNYKELFSNWEFTSGDYREINIQEDDILYLDPPYDGTFSHYASVDFVWEDHLKMLEWALKFDNPMVISNAATDRVVDLYRSTNFEIDFCDVHRFVAANGQNRGKAKEIVAFRNI